MIDFPLQVRLRGFQLVLLEEVSYVFFATIIIIAMRMGSNYGQVSYVVRLTTHTA